MSYLTTSIEAICKNIEEDLYVLPDIQREFVWRPEQIEQLFDSLMKDYPIGAFLFWEIDSQISDSYKFYSFLKKYHPLTNKHNKEYTHESSHITAILDGQQRLTALYIGLRGSYAVKKKNYTIDKESSYLEKFLYLNLSHDENLEENEELQFKFLTEEESVSSENLWYKVSDIISCNIYEYCNNLGDKYSPDHKNEFGGKLITLLKLVKSKETLSYYLEKTKDSDKILDIFIRANSGGTKLGYSDLLLSTATSLWSERNAREEIYSFVDEINKIDIGIDADFIMKACLVLTDQGIKFKKSSFKKENIIIIESQWKNIKKYIQLSADLMYKYGYSSKYIPAKNVLMIIAYHLKIKQYDDSFIYHDKYFQERNTIIKWVRRAFLKQIFSGGGDATLTLYRNLLKNNTTDSFPFQQIEQEFQGQSKDISISEETLKQLYNEATFSDKRLLYTVMSIIFGSPDPRKSVHIDHLYPQSSFTQKKLQEGIFGSVNKIDEIKKFSNHISNLQFLEGTANRCKSAKEFSEWVTKRKELDPQYRNTNIIPDLTSYSSENFIEFCEKRSQILFDKFKNNI